MTIYTLKEIIHDRTKMLEAGIDQMTRGAGVVHGARGETFERGMLEGRLEEARVMFRLVDRVAQDQVTLTQEREDHSLRIVPSMIDRYDPNRC